MGSSVMPSAAWILPAELAAVGHLRRRAVEFARAAGASDEPAQAIALAVSGTAPRLQSPAAALRADCGAGAESVRDQVAAMLLLEAPELANRLHKRWPLATLQIRGHRYQRPGSSR